MSCTRRILILLVLSVISVAHSAEYTYAVGDHTYAAKKASDCFEVSDHAVAECLKHFFEGSEKDLETTFNNIRSRLVRDKQLFEETQAKWVSFKNSECEVRSVGAEAYRDPERQKSLFVRACAAELNAQRVLQLQSLSLGCDSCLH